MNYEDLDVFKKAHNLVLKIYQITENFPAKEQFRIVSQMIKAAYSIPANIAEGSSRNTTKEYLNYLFISRGSLNELKYFLKLSKDLNYVSEDTFKQFENKCNEVGKLLNGLINSLKKITTSQSPNPKS